MEFCFYLVHDPVELLQEATETPAEIEYGDMIEISKYNGKTTIRRNEAFFISLRKSIHISFLNGNSYLTIFDRKYVSKFKLKNGELDVEKYPNYYIPQSIEELQDVEKTLFGEVAKQSSAIPITKPSFRQYVHSAPP